MNIFMMLIMLLKLLVVVNNSLLKLINIFWKLFINMIIFDWMVFKKVYNMVLFYFRLWCLCYFLLFLFLVNIILLMMKEKNKSCLLVNLLNINSLMVKNFKLIIDIIKFINNIFFFKNFFNILNKLKNFILLNYLINFCIILMF